MTSSRKSRENAPRSAKPQDFAVFYRTNALSRTFEHAFHDYGIPYQIVNGVEFYQRKEIKDALAYLRLINNPRDDVALQRIINVPPRRIGKTTVQRLENDARDRNRSVLESVAQDVQSIPTVSKVAARRVRDFVALFHRLSQPSDAPLEELLGLILTETGYLDQLKASELLEDQDRAANLEELLTAAREFDEECSEPNALEAFLEQASLVNDADAWDSQSQKVTLMTLHAAKGLEFPVVFIVAVEQNLLPHERSQSDEQLEEERRLLFVGITRAKHRLQMSLVKYRAYRGGVSRAVPSMFLMELPRDEMELKVSGEVSSCALDDPGDPPPYLPPCPRGNEARAPADYVLQTATELLEDGAAPLQPSDPPPVNPDFFRVGMAVIHPTYGLGKIAALSGQGERRTGTINFAQAGQKKFVLHKSPLRPVR